MFEILPMQLASVSGQPRSEGVVLLSTLAVARSFVRLVDQIGHCLSIVQRTEDFLHSSQPFSRSPQFGRLGWNEFQEVTQSFRLDPDEMRAIREIHSGCGDYGIAQPLSVSQEDVLEQQPSAIGSPFDGRQDSLEPAGRAHLEHSQILKPLDESPLLAPLARREFGTQAEYRSVAAGHFEFHSAQNVQGHVDIASPAQGAGYAP